MLKIRAEQSVGKHVSLYHDHKALESLQICFLQMYDIVTDKNGITVLFVFMIGNCSATQISSETQDVKFT